MYQIPVIFLNLSCDFPTLIWRTGNDLENSINHRTVGSSLSQMNQATSPLRRIRFIHVTDRHGLIRFSFGWRWYPCTWQCQSLLAQMPVENKTYMRHRTSDSCLLSSPRKWCTWNGWNVSKMSFAPDAGKRSDRHTDETQENCLSLVQKALKSLEIRVESTRVLTYWFTVERSWNERWPMAGAKHFSSPHIYFSHCLGSVITSWMVFERICIGEEERSFSLKMSSLFCLPILRSRTGIFRDQSGADGFMNSIRSNEYKTKW
jgi:hypothetical protein